MNSLLEKCVKSVVNLKKENLSLDLCSMNNINPKVLEDALHLSVEDIIDSSKYRYIGGGTCRTVLDLGNGYVVKLTEEDMTKDNSVEWNVWCKSPAHLKKFLAPCYLDPENSQKIFMPKAEPVMFKEIQSFFINEVGIEKTFELMNAIRELSSMFNLLYIDLVSSANWGKIGEDYKLIDYGLLYGGNNEE